MAQSKDFPDCFYRVTIKGLCVRDGKVLMIKESAHMSGKWEMPGGGLDFGEDICEGFKREILEEMGLKVTKMSEKPVYMWTYKYEKRRDMDWYYVLVLVYRIEVEDLNFEPSTECEEIGFFSKEEMKDLPFAGQIVELPRIFNSSDFNEPF